MSLEPNFKIFFDPQVVKNDIPQLSKTIKERIKKDIQKKLIHSPEIFGKPLRKTLKGFRSMRCGDYRVVFEIVKSQIEIVIICHRSIVYKKALERLTNKK